MECCSDRFPACWCCEGAFAVETHQFRGTSTFHAIRRIVSLFHCTGVAKMERRICRNGKKLASASSSTLEWTVGTLTVHVSCSLSTKNDRFGMLRLANATAPLERLQMHKSWSSVRESPRLPLASTELGHQRQWWEWSTKCKQCLTTASWVALG